VGRRVTEQPLYGVVYALFLLLAVLPVVYTFAITFINPESIGNNISLLNISSFLLLGKSAIIAATVALISTLSGTALGFLLFKTKIKFSGFYKPALLIPLFISPYILAVAWKDLFFLVSGNTDIISSAFGVILVLTSIYTPLSILITGNAFSAINATLEESGFITIGFYRTIFKITLPLIKPAIISSFVLVFIFSLSEFSVPAFLGVKVFTTEIFTQFSAFYNHSLAILQSSLLLIVCLLLLFAEGKYISDAPFLSVGNRGTSTKKYNLKNGILVSNVFVAGWLIISVVFPFIILFVQSFSGGSTAFLQAFKLLTPTFGNSLLLATGGALIIVITGFVVAYHTFSLRTPNLSDKFLERMMLLLFATPSTIIGISLIKFYNHPALGMIYSGYAIILIGYAGKFMFIATKLIGNALKQIPPSMDEAARMAGISSFSRLQNIIIPMIFPTLLVAFVISFIFSLGELGTTIMVYPPGTEIMPVKVYTIMANAPQSLVSSMTLIVFSVTLLFITGFYLLAKPFLKRFNYAVNRT